MWSESPTASRRLLNEVLLAPIIDNELYQGALYPHLGVEETFLLLRIFWFVLLDLCSGNSGIGLRINNMFPFVIPLVRF